jgi:hypothetical protein
MCKEVHYYALIAGGLILVPQRDERKPTCNYVTFVRFEAFTAVTANM